MKCQSAKNIVCYLLLLVVVSSCNSQPKLKLQWTIKGDAIKTPESVIYDRDRDVIYVANINNNPDQKDGNGFISIISKEGKVLDTNWVDGLDAPKGMGIYKDKLYVTDIDQVVVIDINKGAVESKIPVSGAQFLNDITVSKDGVVYISDSKVSSILKLEDGKIEKWCNDKLLSNCNGLYDNGAELIFATTNDQMLKRIDKKTKKIKIIAEEVGHGDGVVSCDAGEYIVSDWMGQVFYVNSKNKMVRLLDTRSNEINAADIEYIRASNLLIVPTFFKNSIMAYTFTR